MAKQRDPKEYAREIETVVQDALYNIAQSVGDAIDDAMGNVKDVSDFTLKDIKKGFADLSKINSTMAQATISASKGDFNRAKAAKIILERRAKERALQSSIAILELNKSNLNKKQLKDLEKQTKKFETVKESNIRIKEALEAQVDASNRINKAQGISGALLGGLAKLSSKAGLGGLTDVFTDAKNASADLADELTDGGTKSAGLLIKSKVAAKGMGLAFKGAVGYLAGPVGIAMLLGKVAKFLVEIDKRAAMLANSLNMTKLEAANFDREILRASGGIDYLNQRLGEAAELAASFADSTGIIATNLEVFNADLGVISRRFGLSAEHTAQIAKNVLISGQSAEEFAVNALGAAEALEMQNGVNFTNQAIMKDIAELSATQFLNLKAQPGLIANAVTQARRFGLTMATIEGTQSSLLNFSQSISDEINAELLLGRQLNLSRARSAALQNDYATVAAEISREIGKAADFSEMNYFQQEALAKSVGMTREELAKSLKEQEALEAAGFASAEARERKYQALRDRGLSQEKALQEIGMEEFTRQKQNISFQEKMNNLLHNMKMIFVQAINPLLQKATQFLEKNPEVIQNIMNGLGQAALKVSDFFSEIMNGSPIMDTLNSKIDVLKGKLELIRDITKTIFAPFNTVIGLLATGKEFFSGNLDKSAAIMRGGETLDDFSYMFGRVGLTAAFTDKYSGGGKRSQEEIDRLKEEFAKRDSLSAETTKAIQEGNIKTDNQTKAVVKGLGAVEKAAAAGADVSQKASQASKGTFTDSEGNVYTSSTDNGVTTTPLLDENGNYKFDSTSNNLAQSADKQQLLDSVSIKTDTAKSTEQPTDFNSLVGNLKGGEKTNKLLERLIQVVEKGGDVYLDSRKVGEALIIGTIRQ